MIKNFKTWQKEDWDQKAGLRMMKRVMVRMQGDEKVGAVAAMKTNFKEWQKEASRTLLLLLLHLILFLLLMLILPFALLPPPTRCSGRCTSPSSYPSHVT